LVYANGVKGAASIYVTTYVGDAYQYLEPTQVLKRRIIFSPRKENISMEFHDILPKELFYCLR
jgi:hypothetical protein